MATTKQVTSPEVIGTLSDSELDAVSGGQTKTQENQEQLRALETFKNLLQKAGQI